MAPRNHPKPRKPKTTKPPKPSQPPLSKPKLINIDFPSLHHLISTYKTQHLPHPTSNLYAHHLLDLTDHWDLLIFDCFQEIYVKSLKCTTCPFAHYTKSIENSLENIRMMMERTPVLEVTEEDVEEWESEIEGVIEGYFKELERDGGCPEMRPKPGTLLADGRLVLDEWEESVRVEWMERMFGVGWREHPVVTGVVEESGEVERREMLEVGGDMVVMETVYDEVIGHVAPQVVDQSHNQEVVVDFDDEEEEEEGIAARVLRELGMQDYEYRGKEIDYGKPGPDEFVRETDEAREERLMREFGVGFGKNTRNGEGASRKYVDLTMDFDEDGDDIGLELRWD